MWASTDYAEPPDNLRRGRPFFTMVDMRCTDLARDDAGVELSPAGQPSRPMLAGAVQGRAFFVSVISRARRPACRLVSLQRLSAATVSATAVLHVCAPGRTNGLRGARSDEGVAGPTFHGPVGGTTSVLPRRPGGPAGASLQRPNLLTNTLLVCRGVPGVLSLNPAADRLAAGMSWQPPFDGVPGRHQAHPFHGINFLNRAHVQRFTAHACQRPGRDDWSAARPSVISVNGRPRVFALCVHAREHACSFCKRTALVGESA